MNKNITNIISNNNRFSLDDKIRIYKSFKISIIFIFALFIVLYMKKGEIPLIKKNNDHYLITSKNFTKDKLIFNLINHKSYYNHQFNLVQIYFKIQVFDSLQKLILPSDLTLNYNLHILCFIKINNTININSMAAIEEDKYFTCNEFFYLNEMIELGIIIYEIDNNHNIKKDYSIFNLGQIHLNSDFGNKNFKYLKNKDDYSSFPFETKNEKNMKKMEKLKKLYISKPLYGLKRNFIKKQNQWDFLNIYNEYFCFCVGFNCLNIEITKQCKYYFYLYLIDINSNIYKKTHYLLMDFIFKKYSSDDVYPIFEGMINHNLNAHYLTEKEEIYDKYCHQNNHCDLVIYANEKNYKINDEFLEKHFTLILKLKLVLSSVGVDINYINNLFYNIDYITYICIGHGVSYFKDYLYKQYYGPQNFDKILIPNSDILTSQAIHYGWKDQDIIKFNLPRWEKYNIENKSLNANSKVDSNSIFVMFTWRELKRRKKISYHYINNIINLLKNDQLINNLSKKNLTLYFTLHHQLFKYKNKFEKMNNVKYIEEDNIAECLSKTNLIVTDFSSIIFDMIYRRKPYIIYIPDLNDSKIKKIYNSHSYNVINKFKTNKYQFENVNFDINSTINKINYYIDNDFKLDDKLKEFYNKFNLKKGNIIDGFIKYILTF